MILPASAFPEKTGTFTNTDRTVQLGRKALRAARRCAAGPRHHRRDGARARARLALHASARRVRRDAPGDAVDRRHHVGAARARERGHVSVRAGRRSRASPSCSSSDFPTASGRAKLVPAQIIPAAEQPDTEYPFVLITGPPARALAHRQHDAAQPRCSMRSSRSRWRRCNPLDLARARRHARRRDHRRVAPRQRFAVRARRRRHAARQRVHSVLLLRGRGEPADESGARSVRQDSGVQVLRGARHRGRHARSDARIRTAGDARRRLDAAMPAAGAHGHDARAGWRRSATASSPIIITIMVLELKVPHGDERRGARAAAAGVPELRAELRLRRHLLEQPPPHAARARARRRRACCGRTCTCCSGCRWCRSRRRGWARTISPPSPTALYGVVLLLAAIAYWILQQLIIASEGPDSLLAGRSVAATGRASCRRCSTRSRSRWRSGRRCSRSRSTSLVALMWLVPDRRIEKAVETGNA